MRQKMNGRGKAIALQIFFVLALICQNHALAVNWNSIEVNDIEYYIQTDKSVYDLGENVEMLYRVTNLSDEDVMFSFPRKPVWNFWVEKDGNNTWTEVNGWFAVVSEFALAPGEYIEFPNPSQPLIWDMRDNNGIQIQSGKYLVIGGLDDPQGYYDYTKVSVLIEVVPEPTSVILFATGLPLLRIFFRKRKKT